MLDCFLAFTAIYDSTNEMRSVYSLVLRYYSSISFVHHIREKARYKAIILKIKGPYFCILTTTVQILDIVTVFCASLGPTAVKFCT